MTGAEREAIVDEVRAATWQLTRARTDLAALASCHMRSQGIIDQQIRLRQMEESAWLEIRAAINRACDGGSREEG